MQQVLESTEERPGAALKTTSLKILFIAPLPPPVHGQSLASKVFLDSIAEHHRIFVVDMTKKKSTGLRAEIRRAFQVFNILAQILRHANGSDRIYLTISQSFWGNLKDILIYLLCFRRLDKMVVHLHGGESMRKVMHGRYGLTGRVNAFFLRRLRAIVILGESHRGIFSGFIPPGKIHVVPNFAEDWLFTDEERLELKFSNRNGIRFLYLSNFLPGKGYQELLEAWEGLPDAAKRRASIHFAGAFNSEGLKRKFLKQIESDPHLHYHGVVEGAAKKNLLEASHVFCLPTYYANEGQPISILEAYASGCAVVTTDHSGIRDIFTGKENGYQVEKGSAYSIRSTLQYILDYPEALLPIAQTNRKAALSRYRTKFYNQSLHDILIPDNSSPRNTGWVPQTRNGERAFQICTNCVMDTSDSAISFDDKGVCDHCRTFYNHTLPNWNTKEKGRQELEKLIAKIKTAGRGKDFDCIIGMSGGIDSSYLTYLAKQEFGLKPLVFHVDAGWNSQEAVNNIEKIIDNLGLDLYTEVIDWEEMRDLQLAFFKSGVPHIDTPQDHSFFATMYKFAEKYKVKYILTGANLSTECIRNPIEWMYYQSDSIQLRDIHRRFGTRPLKRFPTTSILRHKIYLPYIKGIQVVRPLNYVPYVKQDAIQHLVGKFGWQPYPQKHFESRFTRFYEGYWLYEKFGFDTRKVQYSSLIVTGQMTRDEALQKLKKVPYDPGTIDQDFEYVATKLGISAHELREYFNAPNKTYKDYKSQQGIYALGAKTMKLLGLEVGGKR